MSNIIGNENLIQQALRKDSVSGEPKTNHFMAFININ